MQNTLKLKPQDFDKLVFSSLVRVLKLVDHKQGMS